MSEMQRIIEMDCIISRICVDNGNIHVPILRHVKRGGLQRTEP